MEPRRNIAAFDPENPAVRKIRELRERLESGSGGRLGRAWTENLACPKVLARPKRASNGTRFTTDYAIAWGRKQGWRLLDRERFDSRTKRHHDLMLGMDALLETPDGLAAVQGAGRHERAEHQRRFEARGGRDRAVKLGIKCYYLEFVRSDREPRLVEEWS